MSSVHERAMRAECKQANGVFRQALSPNDALVIECGALKYENQKLKEELNETRDRCERLENDIRAMTAPKAPFHAHKIALEVARKYRLSLQEMISYRRDRYLVRARQEAMWQMRTRTDLSYPQIGKILGGRDHTTVLHGVREYEKRWGKRNG